MKKQIINLSLSVVFVSLLIVTSCKKEQSIQILPEQQNNKLFSLAHTSNNGSTILGNKLVNPYQVENMILAKKKLDAKGVYPKRVCNVKATHLYIKFKPENVAEYDKLSADTGLDLVDFPMDYDIRVLGNWYREPLLNDTTPTPQYTVVPINYVFEKNIKYEILDKLYLPEWDRTLMGNDNDEDYDYLRQLLNEAYVLNPPNNRFGYQLMPIETGVNDIRSGGGPDGFVKVFDTRLNTKVPLEGADILALNGMSFYHGTTDASGQYWLDNWFQGNSIVLVKQRKKGFAVRSNFFSNANVARASYGTYCDVDIETGMERMYSTMFRAAYRYYYGNVDGLERPFRALFNQVLVAKDESGTASGVNYIAWPSLKIWRYNNNKVEYGTDEIFSTTIHELAHTAHVKTMNAGALQYSQLDNIIRESWPVAVEWFITGMEYREKGILNYGLWNYNPNAAPQYPNRQAYQYWTKNESSEYTNLFINLVDNINDATVFAGRPIDNVTGYKLSIIQSNFLRHVYGLGSLSTKLKDNKTAGVSDAQIDQLLSSY